MPDLPREIASAVRTLLRAPDYTLPAVATLAIGLAGATTVTALGRTVLRPLPLHEPDRLVSVQETRNGDPRSASPGNYLDWRRLATRTFTGFAAHQERGVNVVVDGQAEHVLASEVSGNFFEVLGAPARFGAGFDPTLDVAYAERAAVISDDLWREAFGADPSVAGRDVRVDDLTYRVAGVAPADFAYPDADVRLWVRARTEAPEIRGFSGDLSTMRDAWYFDVVARTADGADLSSARAELEGVAARLAVRYPDTNEGSGVRITPLLDATVGDFRSTLWALAAAVALLVLTAAVDVTHLVLARSEARRTDTAVRIALGAGRSTLARAAVLDGVLLATAAWGAGTLAGSWALRGVVAGLGGALPRASEARLDAGTVLVSLTVALVIGTVVGLAGWWRSGAGALRSGSLRVRGGASGGSRWMMGAQAAAAVALLAGAGLLGRSIVALSDVDLGVVTDRLTTARLALPEARSLGYAERVQRYAQVAEAVAAVPGVESAGVGRTLPLAMGMEAGLRRVGVADEEDAPSVSWQPMEPGYAEAAGLRVLRGRGLSAADGPDDALVGVMNETAARLRFGPEDPVGQQVTIGLDGHDRPITVVGVVADVRTRGPAEAPGPVLYRPISQTLRWGGEAGVIAFRTAPSSDAAAGLAALRGAARGMPVWDVRTGDALTASFTRERSAVLGVVGVFAAAALLLGSVGVYGVTSFAIRRARREIGVRMALGADGSRVVREVVGRGMATAALGAAAGLVLVALGGGVLGRFLFGVDVFDPLTWLGAGAAVAAFTLVALALPARSAANTEPAASLRAG